MRQTRHPVGGKQPQRIPCGREPPLRDLPAFEQHVVVARLGEEAAGGESGLARADDESLDELHGSASREPGGRLALEGGFASDQPVTTSMETGTPLVSTS